MKQIDQIDPKKCRERVQRLFTAEVMTDNYEEVFKSIIG
jgi:hypothetical protein